jgi:type II secretory pathway pseudopilin PulG
MQAASLKRPALITLLAVLHFLTAGLMAFALVLCLASLGGKNSVGLPAALISLIFGAVSLLAGIGLWKLESYGRTTQIILSCFGLLGIPFGTLISILILIYLNKPGVQVLFSGKSEHELTSDDRFALQNLNDSGSVVVIVAVIVVAGIVMAGIIAAIAVPNLLTAMQRAKQKRTMADMKAISADIEQYRQANGRLPEGVTVEEIAGAIHTNVKVDAWGNALRYHSDGQNYWILSAGKDGALEHTFAGDYTQSATPNFDGDIVIRNGEWLEAPETSPSR